MTKLTKKEKETERFNAMKAMHTIVLALNNETGYFNNWILIVPDMADDDDLMDIACDEELFSDCVHCFKMLMRSVLKDGLYIAGKVY